MACWRGECRQGCYYLDACSEGALQARAEAAEVERDHWITQARRIAAERDKFEAEVERLTRVAAAYNQMEAMSANVAAKALAHAQQAEARVSEFQHNALEMARKADIAEVERDAALAEVERLRDRVEEAEFHVRQVTEARDRAERQAEALKAAAEKVGHQAVCPVYPCDCWMRDLAPLLEESSDPECPSIGGDHHWLDRPESDTRECLICGEEGLG